MIRNNLLFATCLATFCLPTVLCAQSFDQSYSSISGFTEPYRSIEVAAAEMGTISHVEVEEGQTIESGAILARLNEDVHEASVGMAKEKLDARGRLHSAQAEAKMQHERYQKLVGLYQRNNASQIEVDRAQGQLEVAAASVEAVQDDFRIASFEYKRALAQLEMRRLRSPIDGVVTRVHKDPGEFVSPSDPVVVSVVQLNPLKAIFSVPQTRARELASGHEIELEMGQDRAAALGVVEFVSPTTDAQSGTRRVTIRIDNSNSRWQSGDVCVLPGPEQSDSDLRTVNLDSSKDNPDFRLVTSAKDEK